MGGPLAGMVDHTVLAAHTTLRQVEQACADAVRWGCATVCVSPTFAAQAAVRVAGTPVGVCSVVGFPSGAHAAAVKCAEAALLAACGVDEIDLMIDLGGYLTDGPRHLAFEVAQVRAVLPAGRTLKVIVESAALTGPQLVDACLAAVDGGADFVKSSTGMHPAGGATVDAVALMAGCVGGHAGVKASGGIRTAADARRMMDAGATRIGSSAGASLFAV